MALRWKKVEKSTGLAAVGEGPRGSYLRDGEKGLMYVYPIGGSWHNGELKGWKYKLVSDRFKEDKFKNSKIMFLTDNEAKIAAKAFYLNYKFDKD